MVAACSRHFAGIVGCPLENTDILNNLSCGWRALRDCVCAIRHEEASCRRSDSIRENMPMIAYVVRGRTMDELRRRDAYTLAGVPAVGGMRDVECRLWVCEPVR